MPEISKNQSVRACTQKKMTLPDFFRPQWLASDKIKVAPWQHTGLCFALQLLTQLSPLVIETPWNTHGQPMSVQKKVWNHTHSSCLTTGSCLTSRLTAGAGTTSTGKISGFGRWTSSIERKSTFSCRSFATSATSCCLRRQLSQVHTRASLQWPPNSRKSRSFLVSTNHSWEDGAPNPFGQYIGPKHKTAKNIKK